MKNVGESESRNSEYKKKYTREKLLQELVGEGGVVVFDIGAHFGESVAYIRNLLPQSEIYSFEPDPDSFGILSAENIPGVYYFNLALSDNDGEAVFYRNRISHTNSLLRVNAHSQDSIALSREREKNAESVLEGVNVEITVPTQKLDTFCHAHKIDHIDLLKIDVQGAERAVLQGAADILERTKVIVLEISFFDYYEKSSSFLDVESLLLPFGFRLFSISEISNNPMNGRTDWAEVIYKRSGALGQEIGE